MKPKDMNTRGHRLSSKDDLDFYPTPPWATRALMDCLAGSGALDDVRSICDPACGEGHIVSVLKEYFEPRAAQVWGADIADYGDPFGVFHGWYMIVDFLAETDGYVSDIIITNPPYAQHVAFMERGIQVAERLAAFFLPLRCLSGVKRNQLFQAFDGHITVMTFVERVPLLAGEYDPNASTATDYAWFVFDKLSPKGVSLGTFPEGTKERYFKQEDWYLARLTPEQSAARVKEKRAARSVQKKQEQDLWRGVEL